jgi:hypothetical protein
MMSEPVTCRLLTGHVSLNDCVWPCNLVPFPLKRRYCNSEEPSAKCHTEEVDMEKAHSKFHSSGHLGESHDL